MSEKGLPKGLSWRGAAGERRRVDESRPQLRKRQDREAVERAPTQSLRVPRVSNYSMQNPGHVDCVTLPRGLRGTPPASPGRPLLPSAPPPLAGRSSAPSMPAPSAPVAPPPPPRSSARAAALADADPRATPQVTPEPPLAGGDRHGSGERARPPAASRPPSEPDMLSLPLDLPPAPHLRAPKPRMNTVQGQPQKPPPFQLPPIPSSARRTAPSGTLGLPAIDSRAPTRPRPDSQPDNRAPTRPRPASEPHGTLTGFVPPRISSAPPPVSPGGTLHGVDPPAPGVDRSMPGSDRPTPLAMEVPPGLRVPNEPRRPDGTLIGFDPPVPADKERPTARPPAPDGAAEGVSAYEEDAIARTRSRTPDGTLLGFDGPRAPKPPRSS